MSIPDYLVVGSGIFGHVIGEALRRQGAYCINLDANYDRAGSKPAACLMKPSWLSAMPKGEMDKAFSVLDDLYKVHEIGFNVGLGKAKVPVFWVDPYKILHVIQPTFMEVEKVGPRWVENRRGERFQCKREVIVAAGIWTPKLVPSVEVKAQTGVAFKWEGQLGRDPFIRPWAPYKQTVGFNIDPGHIWVGDGSALKPESMTLERIWQSGTRCALAIDRDWEEAQRTQGQRPETLVGHRPYAKTEGLPCLLKEIEPGLRVATGGAKNGTAAAGWAAYKILTELRL